MRVDLIPFFGGKVFDEQVKDLRVVGFYPIARPMGVFETGTPIHDVALDNLSPVFAHKVTVEVDLENVDVADMPAIATKLSGLKAFANRQKCSPT